MSSGAPRRQKRYTHHEDTVRRFFTGNDSSYDLIVTLFTYGADVYWKRRMLARVPPARKILELACGTGILTLKLARKYPQSQIVGVDLMPEYIARAGERAWKRKAANIRLICGRAEAVHLRDTFDVVIGSYLPKYVPAERLLGNIAPRLCPGGRLILHDFTFPHRWLYQNLWHLHIGLMRAVGTPLFPEWRTVFRELGGLVRTSTWLADYRQTLGRHGFKEIEVERLTAGSAAILSAVR